MPFSESTKISVRRRSHFLCCLCHSLGVEVHHIIPHEEGGLDTAENAAPLCPTCHGIYGSNSSKRKFIREARDLWYEICEKRFASASDTIDEIVNLLKYVATKSDLENAVKEITRVFTEIINDAKQSIIEKADAISDTAVTFSIGFCANPLCPSFGKKIYLEVEAGGKIGCLICGAECGKEQLA